MNSAVLVQKLWNCCNVLLRDDGTSEMAARGALASCFDPPLTPAERATAALEGWILGVR